jgi:Cu(I)/Ag(I) efflux system membrane fusion protein
VLFRIFSPELVSAQDDLLRAAAQVGGGDPSAAARRDAARLRLSRLGPSDAEIDRILAGGTTLEDLPVRAARAGVVLERTVVEGGMASPGQTLYRIGDLSTVWVEGALPEGRFGTVQPGQHVRVGAAGLRASLDGVVSELLPEVDATTRTGRVRVRVANPDAALRPDQWATIELTVDEGEHLTVPESAVMYTGPRRVLFVAGEGDLLVPREVQVGAKAEGYVAILGGLEEGESVVRAGNFLVAADSRLKRGGETGGHLPTGASGAAPAESPGSTPAGIDMGAMGGP